MSDLNERLAQEAAELINGGEWRDGKWYSDGHRDAWRKALKPAADRIEKLEAALQEPTLPMLLAGKKSLYSCSEDPEIEDARACFLAMARKALEGKDG